MITTKELIHNLGGASEVGRAIGCTSEAVCNWMRRGHIPYKQAMKIKQVYKLNVSLEEIIGE